MPSGFEILAGDAVARWYAEVAALHLEVMLERKKLSPEGFSVALAELPKQADVLDQFRESAIEGALQLVALQDGNFAGYLQGSVEDYGDDIVGTPFMTIEYLAVAPDCRGQGIAQLLLQEAERRALEHGCTALDILVQAGNAAALAAYQRFGFQPLEQRYAKLLNAVVGQETGHS